MQIKGKLVEGIFLERVNRFAAFVEIDGKKELVHVTNSGRMRELLQEGVVVVLSRQESKNRKTAYDLIMVKYQGKLVSIDSKIPNQLFYYLWQTRALRDFSSYPECFAEVNYRRSRLDFLLRDGQDKCLIELKSVTLVNEGRALFPDAPTERGKKHLEDLIKAKEEGIRAVVIFIIQREDGIFFSPHDEMDKGFSKALRQAGEKGVEIQVYSCHVTKESISLKEQLPVIL